MKTLNINKKSYNVKKLDYNEACKLEKLGFPVMDCLNGKNIVNQSLSIIRAYCAWIMDADIETATKEVSEHLKKGYAIEDIIDDITKQFIDFKITHFGKKGFKFNM